MTTNSRTATRFTIDFINKKIEGTKASFSKASKGYGPEYEELVDKIHNHPDFKCVEISPKKCRNKRTYKDLSTEFIHDYIFYLSNDESLKAEYNHIINFSKDSKCHSYPLLKKWFLENFESDNSPFDMKEAKKKLIAYNVEMATKYGESNEEEIAPNDSDTTEDNAA